MLAGKNTFGKARVYLYTHWGGYDMRNNLAAALDRGRGRWGDGMYLARIIFSDFVGGEAEHRAETGYGMATHAGDNEHPFLVVDIDAETVWEEADTRESYKIGLRSDSIKTPMPFENFIAKFKEKETNR